MPLSQNQKYILLALVAGFALLQNAFFLFSYQKGIHVDQWDLVPILEQYLNQGNWFELALVHHGGHFHTIAYLIMLPLAALSNWNLLYETFAIVLLNCLSFYLLYRIYVVRIVASTGRLGFTLGLIFAALYFSFGHGGNALWSWQLSIYLTLFGTALTLFAFSRDLNSGNFALAFLGTCIATFSYSCGFVLWPIGVVLLILHPSKNVREKLAYIAIWLTMSAAICLYYLQNIHNTGMSGDFAFDLANTILFLLYYLGTPIAYFSRDASLLFAVAGLIAYVYLAIKLYKRKKDYWLVIVFSLAAYAIFSGLLISVGRLEFGVDQARSFRYLVFSQFFWFSLLCLIGRAYSTTQTITLIRWPLYILFALVLFTSQKTGRSNLEIAQINNDFYQQLINVPSESRRDLLLSNLAYPPQEELQRRIEVLDKYNLNFYRSD